MIVGNDFTHHVVTRLTDFFTFDSRWHRQLWNVGLVLALDELDQAIEGQQDGVISKESVKWLAESIKARLKGDPGVGSDEQREALTKLLQGDLTLNGVPHLMLQQISADIRIHYLDRWEVMLRDNPAVKPSRERTARAIGAHLLDLGFSGFALLAWLKDLEAAEAQLELVDLLAEAASLAQQPAQQFEILVLYPRTPPGRLSPRPPGWLRTRAAKQWLDRNGFGPAAFPATAQGALLLTIDSADSAAALAEAADVTDRLAARATVGTRSSFAPLAEAFVAGDTRARLLRRSRRVDVHSIDRHAKLYSLASPTRIDAALELVSHLDSAPGQVAVAGGWSAVEFLLRGPGDAQNVAAADRLAALVACSWPRAELTTMARSRMGAIADDLSNELQALETNRERCDRLVAEIVAGSNLALPSKSDEAALHRMSKLLKNPGDQLNDVQRHAQESVRRLYRQRNLVLHGGRIRSAALEATLRTAAPLVGAGIDRLAHSQLSSGREPLEVAARAVFELARAGGSGAPPVTALLE